jgi:hypothetical protein
MKRKGVNATKTDIGEGDWTINIWALRSGAINRIIKFGINIGTVENFPMELESFVHSKPNPGNWK